MKRKTRRLLIALGAAAALTAGAAAAAPYIITSRIAKQWKKGDDKRDDGLETPRDITRIDDIPYGSGRLQRMDIYYPAGTWEPRPTIVSVHGGGYFYGTKETYQWYCMDLASRGFTVVNFSYRLAPADKFPAQLEDVNAAVSMAVAGADEFMIDTSNMFFVGDSAGAQLLSTYAAAWADREYAEMLGLDIPVFSMNAIALNCGMYSVDRNGAVGRIYIRRGTDAALTDALSRIGSNYPPCFVMSSTGDFLLPNAAPMGELLDSKGVENVVKIYGDNENKPGHVFHVDIRDPVGRQCNDDECDFFRRHLI